MAALSFEPGRLLMRRHARPSVVLATLGLLCLAGCSGTGPTAVSRPPAASRDAYNHGYATGRDALETGNASVVMQGDKMAAVTACENVVAHFYAGGTLPPGFTVEQKENWYTGCEDAVETAAQDDSRATRPPSAEVSESS